MSALDVLSKEIDEAYKSIASQHDQIKYYFQIYLAALAGLFTLTGYFSSGGISRDETIIGIISVFSVFCLGWIFLSIVAHKVSMLIFLYKHLTVCRAKRLEASELHSQLQNQYVLPVGKKSVRMPNLLHYLPYFVFIFNFLILCGGVAYYVSPHLFYYQVVAVTVATVVVAGTPYPVVCLSFNRHIRCAHHAKAISDLPRVEDLWYASLEKVRVVSKRKKNTILGILVLGSVIVAIVGTTSISIPNKSVVISLFSWVGITMFSVFRFVIEKPALLRDLLSHQGTEARANPAVQGTLRDKAAQRP